MAIAFHEWHDLPTYGPATTITNTIDIGTPAANSILVVGGVGHTGSDDITSVTWNSVAMTKVQVQAPLGDRDRYTYIFILVNPASGSKDLVINKSGSTYFFGSMAVYTGVAQTGQPDASGKGTADNSASLAQTITTVEEDCWLVGFLTASGNIAAGTSTTLRSAAAQVTAFGDSNAARSSGSNSLNWTGTTGDWLHVVLSLEPAATSSIKTVCGLARASVKTIRGLAMASVKSINGLG